VYSSLLVNTVGEHDTMMSVSVLQEVLYTTLNLELIIHVNKKSIHVSIFDGKLVNKFRCC